MPLIVSIPYYSSGSDVTASVRRRADGLAFDFGDRTFKATPASPLGPAPEEPPPWGGLYTLSIADTPVATFTDGDYLVCFHLNRGKGGVIGTSVEHMRGGSNAATLSPMTGPVSLTMEGHFGTAPTPAPPPPPATPPGTTTP